MPPMLRLSNALRKVLMRNQFCCLCYQNTEGNTIQVEDEVVLEYGGALDTEEMSEILYYILGKEAVCRMSMIGSTICNQCRVSAISSYKFIRSCKENMDNLSSAVEIIAETFNKTVEELDCYKTLFVFLDTEDFTNKQFYDDKQQADCKTAYKRFKCITSARKITMNLDSKRMTTMPKQKTIPTSNMVLDENNSRVHKCKICLKGYSKLSDLKYHFIKLHHPEYMQCPNCPKRFLSEDILQNHVNKVHVKSFCNVCGKSFINDNVRNEHRRNHFLKIVCQKCGRVYSSKRAFRQHIVDSVCSSKERKSSNQGSYICDICKKQFCTKPYLATHMKIDHGDAEGHKCKFCDKKLYSRSQLRTHTLKHTQEKNFVCHECGGRFVTKTSLLYHSRLHTGEKPYGCQHCDKAFVSASRRLNHERNNHMAPSLECSVCQNKFKTTGALLRHKKRHSNPNSRLAVQSIILKNID